MPLEQQERARNYDCEPTARPPAHDVGENAPHPDRKGLGDPPGAAGGDQSCGSSVQKNDAADEDIGDRTILGSRPMGGIGIRLRRNSY